MSPFLFLPKDWGIAPQASPEAARAEGSKFRLGLVSDIEVPGSASPAVLLSSCVTLSNPFDLSEPLNPHHKLALVKGILGKKLLGQ